MVRVVLAVHRSHRATGMMLWIVWFLRRTTIDRNCLAQFFLDILKPGTVEPPAHFERPIKDPIHGNCGCANAGLWCFQWFTLTNGAAISRDGLRGCRLIKRVKFSSHPPGLFGVAICKGAAIFIP